MDTTISLEKRGEEEEDALLQFLKNSCMNCRKDFEKDEIRVLPSAYIQNRDFYVRSGIVQKRLLCVECYNGVKKAERTKTKRNARPFKRGGMRRLFSARGFLSDMIV